MANSIGGGIASGLESGYRMVMGRRQQEASERAKRKQEDMQEREFSALQEQRDYQRQRQQAADERLQDADAWQAVNAERDETRANLTGLLGRYGYDATRAQADPEWAGLRQRSEEVGSRRQALIDKKLKPFLEKQKSDASDYIAALNNGSELPTNDPARFVRATTVTTGRPIADFLRDGDQPSTVERDVQGAMSGIESKNTNAILENVNRILAPSMKIGVGSEAPEDIAGPGAIITGKEIVAIVPAPGDSSKFIPVLKVHVKRGNETGSYIAPVTQDRSAHGDDTPIPPIDMQKAMDYFGRLTTLAHIVNTPQMRSVVEQGMKDAGSAPDDILNAIYATGGTFSDTQRKVKREHMNLGGAELERTVDANTGQVIQERGLPRSAIPRTYAPRSTGLQQTLEAIDADPDLSGEEKASLRREALQSSASTGGRGGRTGYGLSGGGSSGGSISATELKQAEDIGERAAANKIGLVYVKNQYIDQKTGGPASAEQMAAVARARLAASELVRNNAASRKRTSGTDVIGAATGMRDQNKDFADAKAAVMRGMNPMQARDRLMSAGYTKEQADKALDMEIPR